jgi:hypothetical protein
VSVWREESTSLVQLLIPTASEEGTRSIFDLGDPHKMAKEQ